MPKLVAFTRQNGDIEYTEFSYFRNNLSNAEMINLIGNQIKPYRKNINLKDNEFFFDYLKKEIKDNRKMGHLTKIL